MNRLDEFIEANGIDKDFLLNAIYMDIRETILREICEKLKRDEGFFNQVKQFYFSSEDTEATNNVVASICNCKLPKEDILWLTKCIKAFFKKDDTRKSMDMEKRREVIKQQNGKCNICGKEITENSIQIDHIIPWDYVGDELQDNLQGLCEECNSRKSNHVAIALSNLILHMEGKS